MFDTIGDIVCGNSLEMHQIVTASGYYDIEIPYHMSFKHCHLKVAGVLLVRNNEAITTTVNGYIATCSYFRTE